MKIFGRVHEIWSGQKSVMDGQVDGQMDRDRQTDGQTDGWTDEGHFYSPHPASAVGD